MTDKSDERKARVIIEATDPDGESYCLRYTEADSPDQAWSLLVGTLQARRALLNPMATLAFVKVGYIEFGKAAQ